MLLHVSGCLTILLSFNFSAGRYFQHPANRYLNTTQGNPKTLDNYYADQIAAGLEYFVSDDARLTLEVFTKKYDEMITFEILPSSDGRDSLNYHNAINGGRGRSKGLELFIQKNIQKTGMVRWPGPIPLPKELIPAQVNTIPGCTITEM